jgi:hypothetical protein
MCCTAAGLGRYDGRKWAGRIQTPMNETRDDIDYVCCTLEGSWPTSPKARQMRAKRGVRSHTDSWVPGVQP